jgi:hypothetical protein
MFYDGMDLIAHNNARCKINALHSLPRVSYPQVDEIHSNFVEDHVPLKLDGCLASASWARPLWLGKPGVSTLSPHF